MDEEPEEKGRSGYLLAFIAGVVAGVILTFAILALVKLILPLILILMAIFALYYFGWRKPRQRRDQTST